MHRRRAGRCDARGAGGGLSGFVVDAASVSDVPALVGLMHEFYAESNYPLDRAWASASFLDLFRKRERGGAWVARIGTEPAGHVVLSMRHSMEFGGLLGIIDDLFVRPRFRRQGVGAALVKAAFDDCRARGGVAMEVEVGTDNIAATRLYASFGLARNDDGRRRLAMRIDKTGMR